MSGVLKRARSHATTSASNVSYCYKPFEPLNTSKLFAFQHYFSPVVQRSAGKLKTPNF